MNGLVATDLEPSSLAIHHIREGLEAYGGQLFRRRDGGPLAAVRS
jgi:hypothetical protein